MGSSAPAPPPPPDPRETAAAQTGANIAGAIASAQLGQVGQTTPFGTLDYQQTGSYTYTDPYTGQSYEIPTYTAVTQLTPEQQAIFDQLQAGVQNVSAAQTTPFTLSGLPELAPTFQAEGPVDLSNEAVEARLFELGRQRLDPLYEQRRGALEQQLANQGIAIGSAAYNTALQQFEQAETDAYNQLLLTGRAQAVEETLLGRQQTAAEQAQQYAQSLAGRQQLGSEQLAQQQAQLSQLGTLLGAQQGQVPQFPVATPPPIPTTDYAGLINQAYQQELANYQYQQQQQQGVLGGLFGLGSNLLGAFSDSRLKKHIRRVGTLDNGLPVYAYQYKSGGPTQIGLLAEDVNAVKPEAVGERDGYKTVFYDKAVL